MKFKQLVPFVLAVFGVSGLLLQTACKSKPTNRPSGSAQSQDLEQVMKEVKAELTALKLEDAFIEKEKALPKDRDDVKVEITPSSNSVSDPNKKIFKLENRNERDLKLQIVLTDEKTKKTLSNTYQVAIPSAPEFINKLADDRLFLKQGENQLQPGSVDAYRVSTDLTIPVIDPGEEDFLKITWEPKNHKNIKFEGEKATIIKPSDNINESVTVTATITEKNGGATSSPPKKWILKIFSNTEADVQNEINNAITTAITTGTVGLTVKADTKTIDKNAEGVYSATQGQKISFETKEATGFTVTKPTKAHRINDNRSNGPENVFEAITKGSAEPGKYKIFFTVSKNSVNVESSVTLELKAKEPQAIDVKGYYLVWKSGVGSSNRIATVEASTVEVSKNDEGEFKVTVSQMNYKNNSWKNQQAFVISFHKDLAIEDLTAEGIEKVELNNNTGKPEYKDQKFFYFKKKEAQFKEKDSFKFVVSNNAEEKKTFTVISIM